MSTPLSGGYCGGVPPLPIPNREVKPTCADGTAMQCGRVGSRLLLSERSFEQSNGRFFCLCPLWAFRKSLRKRFGVSALGESHFPNGLAFPRMAKVVSRMVWSFRAWRKLFPEWFEISAHVESRFPNGLEFPRSAKVISRMVWCFRAWRKSFPEWFGISALGESRFPNGLVFPHMAKVVSRKV